MADWYYMKDGKKHGPVDSVQLKQLAQTGQLQPTDMILREGLPNWIPASKIKGMEFASLQDIQPNSSNDPLAELTSAQLSQHNQVATSPRKPVSMGCKRTMIVKKKIRPITKVLVILIGLFLIGAGIFFYFSSWNMSKNGNKDKNEASEGRAELEKRLDEWIAGNNAIAPFDIMLDQTSLFDYEIKAFTPDTDSREAKLCLLAKYEGSVAYRATVILSFQRKVGGEVKKKRQWIVYKQVKDGPWKFYTNPGDY